jgi:hypothetical protein
MINKLKSRKGLVVFGSLILLAAGSAAYAYWTTTGSGAGDAATATGQSIVVNQTATITDIYPGGPGVLLEGTFDNPNGGPVRVHQVHAVIDDVTGPDVLNVPTCTTADYTLPDPTVTVDALVPAGNAQGSWTGGHVAMTNTGANQDSCKGATVHLLYTSD